MFSAHPSPVSWLSGVRRSSLDPAATSPSPAPRSFARRGRRRLVTSCPLPPDPRLIHAAQRGSFHLPPLSHTTPGSPYQSSQQQPDKFLCSQNCSEQPSPVRPGSIRAASVKLGSQRSGSVRPSSVRAGCGLTGPTPQPPGFVCPREKTVSVEGSALTRSPLHSVEHPVPGAGRPGQPSGSAQQTLGTGDYTGRGPHDRRTAQVNGCVGVSATRSNPVQSPDRTGKVTQLSRIPSKSPVHTANVSSLSEAAFLPSFSRQTGSTSKPSGLFPVLPPRKTTALPQLQKTSPASHVQKTSILSHPNIRGEKLPFLPSPSTSPGRRSASPVTSSFGPPGLPPGGRTAAPPIATRQTSASCPYPWLISSE